MISTLGFESWKSSNQQPPTTDQKPIRRQFESLGKIFNFSEFLEIFLRKFPRCQGLFFIG